MTIKWNFLPECLLVCLMPSGKRNLITAKAMGLLFLLYDTTLSRDVPLCIPEYVQWKQHGLTFVLLCVPFLYAGVDLR